MSLTSDMMPKNELLETIEVLSAANVALQANLEKAERVIEVAKEVAEWEPGESTGNYDNSSFTDFAYDMGKLKKAIADYKDSQEED